MASNSETLVSCSTAFFGLNQLRKKIVRFQTTLSPSVWKPTSIPELSVKEGKFTELKNELNFFQQHLQRIFGASEEDKDKSWMDVEDITNDCDDIFETIHLVLLSTRESLSPKNQSSVPRVDNNPNFESEFRLEKTKPPTFSGKYTEWQSFSDLFHAAVINNPKISGGLKLVYLKNSLVGDAASIASQFPSTNISFQEAWDLVEKRYYKKREIVFAHLQKLFSLPSVPDTTKGILTLIDTINSCLKNLELLEVNVDSWDVFVVYWAHLKLDPETRKQWLLNTDDELPQLSQFLSFLEKRADALNSRSTEKEKPKSSSSSSAHHVTTPNPGNTKRCPKCDGSHKIYSCPKFLELTPHERTAFAKQKKLCINCLGSHSTRDCKSAIVCQKCSKPHHTQLHFESRSTPASTTSPSTSTSTQGQRSAQVESSSRPLHPDAFTTPSPQNVHIGSHHSSFPSPVSSDKTILMATLLVNVVDSSGDTQTCRVFLDQGSETNFVSESLVARLSLRRQKTCVKVTGIGGQGESVARGIVSLDLHSTVSNFSLSVKALILPKITGNLPRNSCQSQFPHLMGLSLADPTFHQPSSVDILLGAEATSQLLLPGLRVGPPGTPTAQHSRFGWFLTGSAPLSQVHTPSLHVTVCHSSCVVDEQCLDSSLRRFWDLEDPAPLSPQLSSVEQAVDDHFLKTFARDSDGRYEVSLPFINSGELGDSTSKAVSCFKSLEKQLNKDPILKTAYHTQIEDYLSRNWVEKIPTSEISTQKIEVLSIDGEKMELRPFYLPHHVVVKPDNTTTKFRIVFNASSKTNTGLSLNSVLHPGPKIQTDLHPLLTRFRSHKIALSADIVKFYNQVKVNPSHCDFQRFLWRKEQTDPLLHLRFLRVTFGVTSAPFLAIRVLRQLGEDFKADFPLAHHSTQNDFLVDNLLSGASTLEEALEIKTQITSLLALGRFPLQKWASNHPDIINSLSPSERENVSLDIQLDESIKTIGLYWHPASDTFGVKVVSPPPFVTTTKREILSHVARVFDPLQWLAPVTITSKILLQALWKEKLGWDDPIPENFARKWRKYSAELELLQDFRIPRCLTFTSFTNPSDVTFDLVGFCDASNVAYAACVYLRSKCQSEIDPVKVTLIAAKSKVAPVGGETTPRLELCSAVLLCQLVNTVHSALTPTKIQISSVSCFTDSTGALGQIFSKEKQPVFVANRIRKIKLSPVSIQWFHVPGEINPADPCSRGISPLNFLQNLQWLQGPPFLLTEEIPPQPYSESVATFSTFIDPGKAFVHDCLIEFISKTSSFSKMKRLLAYWVRFQNNLRKGKMPMVGPLTSQELKISQISLVKTIQQLSLSAEVDRCSRMKQVKCEIRFLSPFVDSDGILRVGGRMQMSALSFNNRHPILLPKCHTRPSTPAEKTASHFALCVARDFHLRNLHAAPNLLLSLLRAEFWIPRAQNLCSRVFRSCIFCFKQNPQPATQIMAPLPSSRITPDFPFIKVGLDYAGPFEIAATPGRKPRLIKAYVCVFVCMTTRAIHLEFAGGLSTEDFLGAFHRFCSIRNYPSDIYCDGGKNFLGAKNEMEALKTLLASPQHQAKVALFFTGESVNYHFSPPYGPHHGGLWEAAVKSMKLHLSRVIQGHHISIEEFITLLARTAAALNSRPLTPLSNNPDDFEAITPFHFLSLRPPKFIPEVDVTAHKSHRTRWEWVQQMTQHLYKRWTADFLQSLQHRNKWLDPQPNIEVGMMVLLQDVDQSFKHRHWILGRIDAVFPGPDGKVRTCDVRVPVQGDKKFATKVFRRPITRVSPLPLDEDVTEAFISL